MMRPFKVLDVFAGPGGLAEGFASVRRCGRRAFDIALSVEKDPVAIQTLRLRSFVRQFDSPPDSYYDFLDGRIDLEDLRARHSREWQAAISETLELELASPGADAIIDPLVDAIRLGSNDRAVLIGGPPCQAYSLAGRARNKGIAHYVPSEDHRHFLYKEYIRLIGRLCPAAFVMENVKGFLSSSVEGERIFEQVLADLQRASGGLPGYVILPLSSGGRPGGSQYVVHAEKFGVPQRRHRVILVGVRSDLVRDEYALSKRVLGSLFERPAPSVKATIGAMAPVRSGLSRSPDDDVTWRSAAASALRSAAEAAFAEEDERLDRVALRLCATSSTVANRPPPARCDRRIAPVDDELLAGWLLDPRMRSLPNHESRSHMESDLARYGFAACFAAETGLSPKARDFPADLAPAHGSWSSGNFNDRFRVQCWAEPATTVTSHISKDGHYFIHPDPTQCRSLTVREAARLQTFPDNYAFLGNRTQQYVQVGNAVPPLLANQIAEVVHDVLIELFAVIDGPFDQTGLVQTAA
jgi:DNA (cytosine-5)-methyltransferase 1